MSLITKTITSIHIKIQEEVKKAKPGELELLHQKVADELDIILTIIENEMEKRKNEITPTDIL